MSEIIPSQDLSELEATRKICASMQLCLYLSWSEAEGLWYAEASGQGKGEYWEVKRCSAPEIALSRLREKLTGKV